MLDINRRFYLEHAGEFAATRERVQPGVRRVLRTLHAEDTILDLGCGSGGFAKALADASHKGEYIGLDLSLPLLERARSGSYGFPVRFIQTDLASSEELRGVPQAIAAGNTTQPTNSAAGAWAVVTAFAVLHHLPGPSVRLNLLKAVRKWLLPAGRLILSNWQFSSNNRMKSRILPWSAEGLTDKDVDEGDYLIDWRGGTAGIRYVHEFREDELAALAAQSGYAVVDSFLSDGADRRSGLYQTWRPA